MTKTSIIVTLPKTVRWADYEKELDKVKDDIESMFFKVSKFPRLGVGKIGRCYVTHNGMIKGWMAVKGFVHRKFTCSTTGKKWSGNFIERSGTFHTITETPYKGFQGWRYYDGR